MLGCLCIRKQLLRHKAVVNQNSERTISSRFKIETYPGFLEYNFGYDVVRDLLQAMQREIPGWNLLENFFEMKPGKGVYP
jgi:hypothetical protein